MNPESDRIEASQPMPLESSNRARIVDIAIASLSSPNFSLLNMSLISIAHSRSRGMQSSLRHNLTLDKGKRIVIDDSPTPSQTALALQPLLLTSSAMLNSSNDDFDAYSMLVDRVSSALLHQQADLGVEDLPMEDSLDDDDQMGVNEDADDDVTLVAYQSEVKKEALSRRTRR